jgi:LemA protein
MTQDDKFAVAGDCQEPVTMHREPSEGRFIGQPDHWPHPASGSERCWSKREKISTFAFAHGLFARLRAAFLVVALGLALGGCGINTIPTLEEQAKAKLSDVNNQYQRRADLIPNLVETVRGYARQERETLEAVINARAKATSVQLTPEAATDPEKFKQFQEAQSQLSGALGRLIAVSENYPDLKSNQNFLALQSQLEGTENRISVARRDHIEAVRAYNTELRTFPGVLWAKTLYSGHKPMETFTVAEDVRRPPPVRF